MKNLITIPLLALALVGCTFAQRTEIAWLDYSYAPATGQSSLVLLNKPLKTNPQVYLNGTKPSQPYRAIAMMTVDGNWNEEPKAIQAFINLSARAGADAVLIEKPNSGWTAELTAQTQSDTVKTNNNGHESNQNNNSSGNATAALLSSNVRYLFRATAVVWTTNTITMPNAAH